MENPFCGMIKVIGGYMFIYLKDSNNINCKDSFGVHTKIAETIASVAAMKDTDYKALCDAATATSKKALWSNFIAEYEKVYEKAIKQNKKTNK